MYWSDCIGRVTCQVWVLAVNLEIGKQLTLHREQSHTGDCALSVSQCRELGL